VIIAVYDKKKDHLCVQSGTLWQYDYGQVLRIQGLSLPAAVEIHFSLDETGGDAVTRIGITSDSVTDVTIPDSMLENDDTESSYYLYAFVYVTDDDSGETVYKLAMRVKARPKPEASDETEEDLYAAAVALINAAAESSADYATLAQSYAVGGTDTRDGEDEDNAKFYSKLACDALASLIGKVVAAKAEIDDYVDGKEEELKGDTGNVYFAAFEVVDGRLIMYSDPDIDKVVFYREGSRLYYRLAV